VRYLVGLGNFTAGDDAVGVHVIDHVWAHGLDRGFSAIDLGANAMNLVSYLNEETEAMLVVDATQLGLEPGEYLIFTPDQVETQKELAGISTHEGDALKVLDLAVTAGYPIPPVAIMGIEPLEMACGGLELSERLAARVPEYATAAIEHLLKM